MSRVIRCPRTQGTAVSGFHPFIYELSTHRVESVQIRPEGMSRRTVYKCMIKVQEYIIENI